MPPEVARALAIFFAHEGACVQRWLESVVAQTTGPDATDAQVRWQEGRRNLAANLLAKADAARRGA